MNAERPRVLICITSLDAGGAQRHVRDLLADPAAYANAVADALARCRSMTWEAIVRTAVMDMAGNER